MKMFMVALALALVALVILWFGDTLSSWTIGGVGAAALLLICIPISLALFAFLAFQQYEQTKANKEDEVQPEEKPR